MTTKLIAALMAGAMMIGPAAAQTDAGVSGYTCQDVLDRGSVGIAAIAGVVLKGQAYLKSVKGHLVFEWREPQLEEALAAACGAHPDMSINIVSLAMEAMTGYPNGAIPDSLLK